MDEKHRTQADDLGVFPLGMDPGERAEWEVHRAALGAEKAAIGEVCPMCREAGCAWFNSRDRAFPARHPRIENAGEPVGLLPTPITGNQAPEGAIDGPCRFMGAALETDFRPALDCSCGFTAVGDTWADVGEKFDDHLEEERVDEPDVENQAPEVVKIGTSPVALAHSSFKAPYKPPVLTELPTPAVHSTLLEMIGDGDAGRCMACGWPLAESADQGCVAGNCCFRPAPADGHLYARWKQRTQVLVLARKYLAGELNPTSAVNVPVPAGNSSLPERGLPTAADLDAIAAEKKLAGEE